MNCYPVRSAPSRLNDDYPVGIKFFINRADETTLLERHGGMDCVLLDYSLAKSVAMVPNEAFFAEAVVVLILER